MTVYSVNKFKYARILQAGKEELPTSYAFISDQKKIEKDLKKIILRLNFPFYHTFV